MSTEEKQQFLDSITHQVGIMQTLTFKSGYRQALIDVLQGGDPRYLAIPDVIEAAAKQFLGGDYYEFKVDA